MEQEFLDDLRATLVEDVLPVLIVVVVAIVLLRVVRPLLRNLISRVMLGNVVGLADDDPVAIETNKRLTTVQTLADSVLRIGTWLIVVVIVLGILNLTAVIAALGFAAVAIGFAGQDFVRDYLAGFFILVENQFYVGDTIRVGTVSGDVEELTLRHTSLRDVDGTLHIVSNGEIRIASNMTRVFARVNLAVPLPWGTDLARVAEVLDAVGAELAADPAWRDRLLGPLTADRVQELGVTGPTVLVQGEVRAGEQWAVRSELRRRILAALTAAGINLMPEQRLAIDEPSRRTRRVE